MQRIDVAIETHLDHFARLDLANELRTDDVEGDCFGSEDGRIAHPAHLQRTNAERVATGDHSLRSHDDKRVSAFEQTQGIDQPVHRRRITTGCHEMDDHFGIAGRLENRPTPDEIFAEHARIGNIAVMRHSETAARKIGIQRLNVAQAGTARRRIPHMPCGHRTGQFGDCFLRGEILRHVA